jgi:hypothetical protein
LKAGTEAGRLDFGFWIEVVAGSFNPKSAIAAREAHLLL